ncbi:GntR family transcriptional regulator [Streptomyces sp. NPDC005953]|uniref:GntR family transcriptional regulator n=1 Tax=Streptomyces sp. NPDC005953 TaxID=3156719 RepID=UPI0033CE16CB
MAPATSPRPPGVRPAHGAHPDSDTMRDRDTAPAGSSLGDQVAAEYVAGRLRDAIATGIYPAGAPLPPIAALSRQFVTDQSRVTAGVRLLADRGLVLHIDRHTRVAHPGIARMSSPALPLPERQRQGFSDAAIRAAIGEAKAQWRYRQHASDWAQEQWAELRAIAHHLLLYGPGHTSCSEVDVRWAVLMAGVSLPHPDALWSWHIACLAQALAPLLPNTARE